MLFFYFDKKFQIFFSIRHLIIYIAQTKLNFGVSVHARVVVLITPVRGQTASCDFGAFDGGGGRGKGWCNLIKTKVTMECSGMVKSGGVCVWRGGCFGRI